MITFTKKNFLSGLPNLGAQISCAQSRYTTVQIDLKYPLPMQPGSCTPTSTVCAKYPVYS